MYISQNEHGLFLQKPVDPDGFMDCDDCFFDQPGSPSCGGLMCVTVFISFIFKKLEVVGYDPTSTQ